MTPITTPWSYKWTSVGGKKYSVKLIRWTPPNEHSLPEYFAFHILKDTGKRSYLEEILVGKADLYRLAITILRESGLDIEDTIEHQESLLKMAEGELRKSHEYLLATDEGEDPSFAMYLKGSLSGLYKVLGVPNPHTIKPREGSAS